LTHDLSGKSSELEGRFESAEDALAALEKNLE